MRLIATENADESETRLSQAWIYDQSEASRGTWLMENIRSSLENGPVMDLLVQLPLIWISLCFPCGLSDFGRGRRRINKIDIRRPACDEVPTSYPLKTRGEKATRNRAIPFPC